MPTIRKRKSVGERRGEESGATALPVQPHDAGIPVFAYLRVSDIKSARGEISIPDQKERIIRWCEERKYTIIAFYVDLGRTATTDRRKEFRRMISDIETGKYRPIFIVSYDSSRLFRNRLDFGQYEKRLEEFGVTFLNTTQVYVKSVPGVMSRNLMAELDQYVPMITSVRVKEAQLALARQGFWPGGRPCFGIETYVVERFGKKVRRKLRPKKGDSDVVRKIFDLCLNGNEVMGPSGIMRITEWLFANQVKTQSGNNFTANTVHSILTNTSYTGKYIWNYEAKVRSFVEGDEDKEIFEFELEPVVDQATFDRVQLKMQGQAPQKGNDTWVHQGSLLLREIAYCPCGSRLGLATGTGNDGETRRYYLCNKRKKQGKFACDGERVNEQVLDAIVLGSLKETLLDQRRLGQLLRAWAEKEAMSRATRLEAGASTSARAASAEREFQRLLRLAKVDDDLAADQLFLNELSLARKAAVAARNDLAAITVSHSGPENITPEHIQVFSTMMCAVIDGGDRHRTKSYLRSIISKIEVDISTVRIFGDQEVLGELVSKKETAAIERVEGDDTMVRTSNEEWLPEQGSNLRQFD